LTSQSASARIEAPPARKEKESGVGLRELLVMLVLPVIFFLPFYKIFSKAGYPGLLCLTMAVPLLNVIMVLFLPFSEWPILKELKALKQRPTP
jgi:hypothetical protein